jgi:hypothetical protein
MLLGNNQTIREHKKKHHLPITRRSECRTRRQEICTMGDDKLLIQTASSCAQMFFTVVTFAERLVYMPFGGN